MKAGTTTLFDRLQQHPDVHPQRVKEPDFFADDEHFARGMAWYARRLGVAADAPSLVVDASVSCTDPDRAGVAAARIWSTLGEDARLVVLVRDPVARLRSHYRHQVQRRAEHRPLPEAASPGSPYVRASSYLACLGPYLESPLRDRLLAVRTDDLDHPDAWAAVLAHAGLEPSPLPTGASNVSADKPPFTRLGGRLWRAGALKRRLPVPRPVRRMARRLVVARPDAVAPLIASADAPLDTALVERLLDEAAATGERLGVDLDFRRRRP
jgi:hypothetical protein